MEAPESIPPRGSAAHGGDRAFGAELLRRLARRPGPAERYRVEGEIARGGQGKILRIWDEDLQRPLAMKVVLGAPGGSSRGEVSEGASRSVGRFLEEAHVTGRLDHPGIVPVHELGLDAEGRVYFTMKLVQGRDLGAVLELVRARREGWTRTRALSVLLRVCEALAYAHSKGVIHRDLKPSNVMVGEFGEVYVMDWGLARLAGAEDRHALRVLTDLDQTTEDGGESPLVTMEGDVVGTPTHMSPEQARGELSAMGPASDVYAVGAMLYELLAGHVAYVLPDTTPSPIDVWNRVREGPPEPLAERARDAPAELVAICEKAMARRVEQRYPDTRALADDLRAFLEQRVVSAYETGALAELRKWVARNRSLAAALAAAAIATVVGLLWVQHERGVRREQVARAALRRAERDREIEAGVSLALGRAEVQADQQQWDAAQASVDGARALLGAAGSPDAPGEWLSLLDQAEVSIERARSAADLVETVGRVAQRIDVLFDWAATDEQYARLFGEAGVDVDGQAPAQVAARLVELGVGAGAVPALDRWLIVRRNHERERAREERRAEDSSGALRLVAVAGTLDDDPLRADLRAALLEDDADVLETLSNDVLEEQPPTTIALLATGLELAGRRDSALVVLRRGALRHPGDYWLRTTLLTKLRQNPVTPGWDREECLEAIGHTQAALALRPGDPDLRANLFWDFLGLAWDAERNGDLVQRRRLSEVALVQLDGLQALRSRRSELLFRAWALLGADREAQALEALSDLVRDPPPFGNSFGRTPAEWRIWYLTRAGSLLLRGGALEDALLAFEPLLERDTGPAFGEWVLARILLRARTGDEDGALRELETCLEAGPLEVSSAVYWTAWSVARLSEEALLTACAASSDDDQVRVRPVLEAVQGELLQRFEALDAASVNRARSAAAVPPWPKAAQPRETLLGLLRYRIGDPEGALEALAEIARPNGYEWYVQALAHARLGHTAEARARYELALADTAGQDLSSRGWEDLFDQLTLRDETEAALGIGRPR